MPRLLYITNTFSRPPPIGPAHQTSNATDETSSENPTAAAGIDTSSLNISGGIAGSTSMRRVEVKKDMTNIAIIADNIGSATNNMLSTDHTDIDFSTHGPDLPVVSL